MEVTLKWRHRRRCWCEYCWAKAWLAAQVTSTMNKINGPSQSGYNVSKKNQDWKIFFFFLYSFLYLFLFTYLNGRCMFQLLLLLCKDNDDELIDLFCDRG